MHSRTRGQFLFELRWEEVRGELFSWKREQLGFCQPARAFSLQPVIKEGFLQEFPLFLCPKMQTCPGQRQSGGWILPFVLHG